ncbi:MAG: helix-turn-helix domain-containing protein [Rhodocyclaceae bacterium]|nr:helix-turn-helix domain-containing protein [Rhodocyclaceae bacterium]
MAVFNHSTHVPMAISDQERTFFTELGERVAALRKQHNITQVQLAETLDVSQQTLQGYEAGRRRIPVSALPILAASLSVTLEELMGAPATKAQKRGPAPKLQKQMEQVSLLPRARQQVVMDMLDGVLAQRGR